MACCALFWACAIQVPTEPEALETEGTLVIARVMTVLLERPGRMYDPTLRFFELQERSTKQRYRVDVESEDKVVIFQVPAGEYELTRVQFSEGPFLSMADLNLVFDVAQKRSAYLGIWRVGIESPRYGRKLAISTVYDREEAEKELQQVVAHYPEFSKESTDVTELMPREAESRLYEVMPYPRYPSYFRRHLW